MRQTLVPRFRQPATTGAWSAKTSPTTAAVPSPAYLAVQKAMYNEKPPDDGHRQNILNSKFVDVGIDVINDSEHGKVWLVTDFGRS
mgnify:CR=1 FL=1